MSSSLAFGCVAAPPSGDLGIDTGSHGGQDGSGNSGSGSNSGSNTGSNSNNPSSNPGAGTNGGSSGNGAMPGGDNGSGQMPTPQAATFELSFDNPKPDVELKNKVDVSVSIDPKGYKGAVDLTVDGLPADVKAELASPQVTLDGSTVVQDKLTLTTISSTKAGNFDFSITGKVDAGSQKATGTLTVKPVITITIPPNVKSMAGTTADPNKTAFGDFPTNVSALADLSAGSPITVNFFNADSIPHRIHASQAGQGFPHGDSDIQPGQMDSTVRKVNAAGTYTYYLHDFNPSILGRIVIQ